MAKVVLTPESRAVERLNKLIRGSASPEQISKLLNVTRQTVAKRLKVGGWTDKELMKMFTEYGFGTKEIEYVFGRE